MAAFYERDGDLLVPTAHTRGPWNRDNQHAGPAAALLAHAAEAAGALEGGQASRLSFEILGPVPVAPLTVSAEVVRPGRQVELVHARLVHEGRSVMTAAVWRLRAAPTTGEASAVAPLPGPEAGGEGDFSFWPQYGGYVHALEWRFLEGEFARPGPCSVWTRAETELIAGMPITPLERLLLMADAASGVSSVLDWERWLFINVDLSIHLARPPEGEWMAMAAETRLGDAGGGVSRADLFDERGWVGASAQSLLVGPR